MRENGSYWYYWGVQVRCWFSLPRAQYQTGLIAIIWTSKGRFPASFFQNNTGINWVFLDQSASKFPHHRAMRRAINSWLAGKQSQGDFGTYNHAKNNSAFESWRWQPMDGRSENSTFETVEAWYVHPCCVLCIGMRLMHCRMAWNFFQSSMCHILCRILHEWSLYDKGKSKYQHRNFWSPLVWTIPRLLIHILVSKRYDPVHLPRLSNQTFQGDFTWLSGWKTSHSTCRKGECAVFASSADSAWWVVRVLGARYAFLFIQCRIQLASAVGKIGYVNL